MRIIHLATSSYGGAGIAARRIVEAQVESGMDSQLFTGTNNEESHNKFESNFLKTKRAKLASKSLTLSQHLFIQKSDLLVTPFSFSILSRNRKFLETADIVHIHAFYNLLNMDDMALLSRSKKVFVTLHDERLFTGGCHYTFGCKGFQDACNRCPQAKIFARKATAVSLRNARESLAGSRDITFITPSTWLSHQARSSALIGKSKIQSVANPVPSSFYPRESIPGIEQKTTSSKITIGFISENLNNPYKGLEVLRAAIEIAGNEREIVLKLFGSGNPGDFSRKAVVHVSKFSNDIQAREAITECDVVVVPSTQDNSPSVVSEALMCGVPVLASRTGGITETLLEFDQPSFSSGSALELADQIISFLPNRLGSRMMERVSEKYSYWKAAETYQTLYGTA